MKRIEPTPVEPDYTLMLHMHETSQEYIDDMKARIAYRKAYPLKPHPTEKQIFNKIMKNIVNTKPPKY